MPPTTRAPLALSHVRTQPPVPWTDSRHCCTLHVCVPLHEDSCTPYGDSAFSPPACFMVHVPRLRIVACGSLFGVSRSAAALMRSSESLARRCGLMGIEVWVRPC